MCRLYFLGGDIQVDLPLSRVTNYMSLVGVLGLYRQNDKKKRIGIKS